jgi:tetratricopeptide (TPR) repeat protein
MNKKLVPLVGIILGLAALTWLLLFWFVNKAEHAGPFSEQELYRQRVRIGDKPTTPAPSRAVVDPNRAIRLGLGSLGLPDNAQNGDAGDLLITLLNGARGLELVERGSMDNILHELNLSISGLVRAKDAVRVGKLAQADWFLLGTPMAGNGTNFVVIRMVDAKTGVFRDTTVVPADGGPTKLAENLAIFVRKCRAEAAATRIPTYLALGTFRDLSSNNRLADFPTQLRSFLTAAYRFENITLLERDHVDALLLELQLDLAGLSENTETNRGAGMQTAVWLLEGDYQGYSSSPSEIELALRISRVFGRQTTTTLRGPSQSSLFETLKATLDQTMRQQQARVYPTRRSEARTQMARGKELAGFDTSGYSWEPYLQLTRQEARLRQRNAEEAIRAFKSVLLLEPTNREAEVYLGACYCKSVVGRVEEGRQLYQQVLEEPVEDHWSGVAAERLLRSFDWTGATERIAWFSSAEKRTANPKVRAIYHQQTEMAREKMRLDQGAAGQPEGLAEKQLREDIQSYERVLKHSPGVMKPHFGMDDYVDFFRPDKTNGARKLAAFLPQLVLEFQSLAPHLTAAALSCQLETNNPVVAQFRRQLESCRAHPGQLFADWDFWGQARHDVYDWALGHGEPELAVKVMEATSQIAVAGKHIEFDEQDRIALAFAYKAAKQWNQALAVFEALSNVPVVVTRGAGPWGSAFAPVLIAEQTAWCKKQLGASAATDPRAFAMGTNCLCMHTPSTFALDANGLWLAIGAQLVHLDFDLRTNQIICLPKEAVTGITSLLVGTEKIWLGTDGEGLFEFDKTSARITHYTEQDGLMMDVISSLCLSGETLWLGYGVNDGPIGYIGTRAGAGGLGLLDLREHKFRSFIPSLAKGVDVQHGLEVGESANGPTHQPVRSIAVGPENDVWFLARGSPLRRFRPQNNVWETSPELPACSALLADSSHLFVAEFSRYLQPATFGPVGISILNFADKSWTHLGNFGVLPSGMVSAMVLDGGDLWLGCSGYIAKIDLAKKQLLGYSPVTSTTIDQIQIGGGFVWAQFDRHLHRARLPN